MVNLIDLFDTGNFSSDTVIIYQAWGGQVNALEAVDIFFKRYSELDAACSHDLVVVFSGWTDASTEEFAKSIALKYTDRILSLPENGLDLGMYMSLSMRLPHQFMCCMSTNSRPRCEAWLMKMKAVMHNNAKIALVGPTGSFGTIAGFQIPRIKLSNAKEIVKAFLFPVRFIYDVLSYFANLFYFPGFPNPHIRTSTFLVKRSVFAKFASDAEFPQCKYDTFKLESGRKGLTRYILGNGYGVRVVGSDGVAYDMGEWGGSNTFRCPEPFNLLVDDRQTLAYENATEYDKRVLEIAAWGKTMRSNP